MTGLKALKFKLLRPLCNTMPRHSTRHIEAEVANTKEGNFDICPDCKKAPLSLWGGLHRHQNSCTKYLQRMERDCAQALDQQVQESQIMPRIDDDNPIEGKLQPSKINLS